MGIKDTFSKWFKVADDDLDYDNYGENYEVETATEVLPAVQKKFVQKKYEGKDMAKINIVEPRVYSEVETIAALLLEKQAVLLNLRRVDEAQARRIIDYMAGIAYAIGGDVQKLSGDIFLCAPSNIEIEGMLSEESEANHINFLDSI
ncbi:DUF552 domain-containing protein [Granulicatella sp. zg-ZJ]|uniref:cell division protein SepF n=1 Tax=unclassified Granulicatella TaxID=2630493 RepID=UPI0013BFD60A|nr:MULTISPECIES: cell division protein SepF [unclassified Granulicatella]MBS4750556.1 cell division protein SepF [Carnobacteriaceae bacterium zg-ZUI78]NEW62937.1 DUF552 domain-containing protein [Granulicatella sp. zg-ZJ]NEW66711.1 DUF552 domain-containing protein [Granulicatella sp. zg-84]QMI85310.1 cell division protein SepF [Carnobacteriaceae bacterium zg-84]